MHNARALDDGGAGCGCKRELIAKKPTVTIDSYRIQFVDGLPGKAQIYPGAGLIQIDRAFWARCTELQRAAVLAHEMAHDEDPNGCESCADARAGARLAWSGYSAQQAVEGLGTVVRSRNAGASVLDGWKAAKEAIDERATYTAGLRPPEMIAPSPADNRAYSMPHDSGLAGVMSPRSLTWKRPRALVNADGVDEDALAAEFAEDRLRGEFADDRTRGDVARAKEKGAKSKSEAGADKADHTLALAAVAGVTLLVVIVILKKG